MNKKSEINQITSLGDQDFILVWIEQFLSDKKSQNLSPNTNNFYNVNLTMFNKYCESQSVKTIQQLNPPFIREYLLMKEQQGLKAGSVHACYRSIKVFLRWFWDEIEPDLPNPIDKVKAPKVEVIAFDGVTIEQLNVLCYYCHKDTFTGERDKSIFMLLLDTGLRAQEACDIKQENVNLVDCSIVIQGKGKKIRTVLFGSDTRKQLRRYLRYSRNSKYLFSTQTGDKMTYHTIRQLLRRTCEKAKIKEISLHDFRRGFFAEGLRNNIDLLTLSRLGGHADLSLLERYAKQSKRDLEEKYVSSVDSNRENS